MDEYTVKIPETSINPDELSLENFIKIGKLYNWDDKMVIKQYIIGNNFEKDYMELITELSKSALDKLDKQIREHQWLAFPADNFYDECYKKKMNPDVAKLLDRAQRGYILGLDISDVAEELKGKTEEMNMPNPYYQPALKKLIELGVTFKDSNKIT